MSCTSPDAISVTRTCDLRGRRACPVGTVRSPRQVIAEDSVEDDALANIGLVEIRSVTRRIVRVIERVDAILELDRGRACVVAILQRDVRAHVVLVRGIASTGNSSSDKRVVQRLAFGLCGDVVTAVLMPLTVRENTDEAANFPFRVDDAARRVQRKQQATCSEGAYAIAGDAHTSIIHDVFADANAGSTLGYRRVVNRALFFWATLATSIAVPRWLYFIAELAESPSLRTVAWGVDVICLILAPLALARLQREVGDDESLLDVRIATFGFLLDAVTTFIVPWAKAPGLLVFVAVVAWTYAMSSWLQKRCEDSGAPYFLFRLAFVVITASMILDFLRPDGRSLPIGLVVDTGIAVQCALIVRGGIQSRR
jgi:hypothetical protein